MTRRIMVTSVGSGVGQGVMAAELRCVQLHDPHSHPARGVRQRVQLGVKGVAIDHLKHRGRDGRLRLDLGCTQGKQEQQEQ